MDTTIEAKEIDLLSHQLALSALQQGLSVEIILKPLVKREIDMSAEIAAASAMMRNAVNQYGEKNSSEECAAQAE